MNRPNNIPQDVWDAADAVAEPLLGRHERGWVMWPLVWPAQEIAARAIMAERERCALITFAAYERKSELCSKIIRRIRSGEGLVR